MSNENPAQSAKRTFVVRVRNMKIDFPTEFNLFVLNPLDLFVIGFFFYVDSRTNPWAQTTKERDTLRKNCTKTEFKRKHSLE